MAQSKHYQVRVELECDNSILLQTAYARISESLEGFIEALPPDIVVTELRFIDKETDAHV